MKTITKQTFLIFGQHIKPYKWLVFIMVAGTTSGVLTETMVPIFYKQFFDVLSAAVPGQEGIVRALTQIIGMVFLLHGMTWIAYRFAVYDNNYFQPKIMENLANTCFQYLHKHSYVFFTNRFVGSLVRRVNRLVYSFEGIADKISWHLYPLTLRIAAILVVMSFHSLAVTGILLVWTILFLTINYWYTLFKLRYDESAAASDTEVTAQLADTITNNTNIKVFASLGQELKWFSRLTRKQFTIRKFTWDLGAHIEAIQAILMIVLEFGVFYFAIRLWNHGILTLGHLVLIQAYLLQIFIHVWDFGRHIRDLYKFLADAEEMVEILNTPHEVQDKIGAKLLEVKDGLIEYNNVDFTYTKTRPILKNFNLTIRPGEKVGLVGPSGGGKTTLVGLLFRFFDVQKGGVFIDAQNVYSVTQDSLRKNIGLVPQDPILFHRTLLENIRYGRLDSTDQEVQHAARLAHCDEFVEKLYDKYRTYVGERGIKLSGGERQRIAIARAILKNAPILVLDEATSSLDSHSESLIQDALAKLMHKKTTIVIAHRLSTIMKMDRIIVLEEGVIVEYGSHKELLQKRSGLYKKLWKLQAGGFIT